jgi:hypothetical protein
VRHILFSAATSCVILFGAGYAQAQSQDFCREFTSTVTIGNRTQDSVGTACLNPDGSWQIVSGNNTGARFFDNGPNGYGSNNVSYIQQPNVTYAQPLHYNYIWRERVYTPPSNLIVINRGYARPYYSHHHSYNYNKRPWGWQQGHGHHKHHHGGGHHGHRGNHNQHGGGHRNHR